MGACVVTSVGAAKASIVKFSTAACAALARARRRSQTANSVCAPSPDSARFVGFCGTVATVPRPRRGRMLPMPHLMAHKKTLLIRPRIHRDVEKAHHHLVIGLLAPAH